MKKLVLIASLLFLLVCPLLGGAYAADDVIKIGVLMNLTGPWASIDGPAWNSIQLAVKDINDAGGLLGKKVEAMCIDTKADEAETVNAATRLCEGEKVNAIIGYCDTHWVLTSAPIAKKYGIPFMAAGATHPRIPERSGAWMACFGDNAQASVIAEYVFAKGLKRAAVWTDSACDFSVGAASYFKDAIVHDGGTVVYEDFYQTTDKDFSALVARLKAKEKEVDLLYVPTVPDQAGLIAKQIREGGIAIPIFSADGADTPLLLEAGKHAEGVTFTTHINLDNPDPMVVNYVQGYEKMYGHKPENAFAALGYDAMLLVAQGIKNANSAEPAKITEGLKMIKELPLVTGKLSYLEGSQVPSKAITILEVKDGKFQLVTQQAPNYMPPPELSK